MGRKTYESLGRPLPNRTNVVITRQQVEIPGCRVVHSLRGGRRAVSRDDEVFVIGGAQIYAQALPLADRFYLTRVFRAYEGDTHFPEWDRSAVAAPVVRILRIGYELPLSFRLRDLRAPAKLGIYTTARLARIPYLCTAKVFCCIRRGFVPGER